MRRLLCFTVVFTSRSYLILQLRSSGFIVLPLIGSRLFHFPHDQCRNHDLECDGNTGIIHILPLVSEPNQLGLGEFLSVGRGPVTLRLSLRNAGNPR